MNKNKILAKPKSKKLELKQQNERRKQEESGELSSSSSSSSTSSSSSSSSSSTNSSNSSGKRKFKRKRQNEKTLVGAEEGEIESEVEKAIVSTLPEEIASKLKSLIKLTEKNKSDYEKHQHKLEKIERAYLKAQKENNKVNMKKCFKYKQKYEIKVDKCKSNIKILQAKRIKLQQQLDSIDSTKKVSKPNLNQPAESQKLVTIPKTVIKLPFPVLNDTRDMKTILSTLETKHVELINKIEQNRFSLGDKQASYQKIEKLKQLEKAYESQLEKINIQLDYVRLALNLEALRERNANQPPQMMMMNSQQIIIDQMANRLNEMYNMMKVENKSYLKQHQQQMSESKQNESETKNQTAQASPPKVTQPQSIDKLNKLQEIVNNSLAAVIAHTAATAHAAAAVAVTNYYMAAYYNQQQKAGSEKDVIEVEPVKPVVPLKKELENASSIFAKYKDKISSFFINTQKVEEAKKVKDTTGLKLLISNYGDDADMSGNEEEHKEAEKNKIETKLAKKVEMIDSDDDDDEQSDESDIEIVTTSEVKQAFTRRNYLLPSLKASYFPLKASIHEVNQLNNRSLIAVEKTKNALTFLGNGISGQKQLKLNDILFN